MTRRYIGMPWALSVPGYPQALQTAGRRLSHWLIQEYLDIDPSEEPARAAAPWRWDWHSVQPFYEKLLKEELDAWVRKEWMRTR